MLPPGRSLPFPVGSNEQIQAWLRSVDLPPVGKTISALIDDPINQKPVPQVGNLFTTVEPGFREAISPDYRQ